MATRVYTDIPEDTRTWTESRKWFSANDDKAWAEKFYLTFIPVFFAYNTMIQMTGWLDAGNFWHITQSLLMWFPYCVILPLILRRNSGIVWYKSWWFKFQLYIAVIVFFMTYFHTEYFFQVLGMRYRFDAVTLYFDSQLLGPDQATALAAHQRVPVGMYLNTMAFFTVYHIAAIVVIRRFYNLSSAWAVIARVLTFAVSVIATAFFFAWAETFLYMTAPVSKNVWYIDVPTMLALGSWFYSLDFLCTFPNIYRLDERPDHAPWSYFRILIEAAGVSMIVLLLDDLWVLILGANFMSR
jgi:cycloeucalenol cycloisomerase